MRLEEIDYYNFLPGKLLRFYREVSKQTQESVGAALGVTFQQVQKYERGINAIAPGKLYAASKFLNVPIQDFFKIPDGLTLPDGITLSFNMRYIRLQSAIKYADNDTLEALLHFIQLARPELLESDPIISKPGKLFSYNE